MIVRSLTLGLAGAAAFAIPHAAPAQQAYGQDPAATGQPVYGQSVYGQPTYEQPQNPGAYPGYAPRSDQPQGGYYSREDQAFGFTGYPEFQGAEDQIRQEIQSGVSQDLLEPDDARDLMAQLRDIRRREAREYGEHGWNLPPDVRHDIRTDLADLDRDVQEARQKP